MSDLLIGLGLGLLLGCLGAGMIFLDTHNDDHITRLDRLEYNTYRLCRSMPGVNVSECRIILSSDNPAQGEYYHE